MTQLFGIDQAEVTALAAAVSDGDPADVFARAAWTCIAEPGDRVAGVLVATLGAADALTALIGRVPAPELAARMDADDRSVSELTQALERWMPRLQLPDVRRALTQAARFRVQLLTPTAELWPVGVDDLGAHTPLALWVRGQLPALVHVDRSYWEHAMFVLAEFILNITRFDVKTSYLSFVADTAQEEEPPHQRTLCLQSSDHY